MKCIFVFALGMSLATGSVAQELARTPPMGWNSWNAFNLGINEKVIRKMADLMVSSGLRDAGYHYLNLDDGWQASRDEKGTIQPDPLQFPSGMKALGDYLHSKGLLFGLYTCAGTMTCGKRPGSKDHEKQDMATYASWGVDYVKVDWCNTDGLDPRTQYGLFRDGIRECGRPMVLSLCDWGVDKPWMWGKGIGQLWRTAGDLLPCWDCKADWGGMGIVLDLDKQAGLAAYSGPGGWNDPDMLQVGNGDLTPEESRSHFSLWCMLAAPLIAGNNLVAMNSGIREILLNREAIAVDQDPLGKEGTRIKTGGDNSEVWAKPLAAGAWAVCLFNPGPKSNSGEVRWTDLGLKTDQMRVRDLWAHRDVGSFNGGYTVSVPSHGAILLKISEDKPASLVASAQWRIKAGGGDFMDSQGQIWTEDKAYQGGHAVGTALDIHAPRDPELYQTERWGPDFSYVLPVVPGKYRVTLKFTEVYLKNPGDRVFDVYINGRKLLDRFDILKEAHGFAKAVDEGFEGIRPDGHGLIRLRFLSEVQNAKVCAIEVIREP